jgi:hypothetical protein
VKGIDEPVATWAVDGPADVEPAAVAAKIDLPMKP